MILGKGIYKNKKERNKYEEKTIGYKEIIIIEMKREKSKNKKKEKKKE